MVTLIQNKRDAIVELCEKYGVVRLDASLLRSARRLGEVARPRSIW